MLVFCIASDFLPATTRTTNQPSPLTPPPSLPLSLSLSLSIPLPFPLPSLSAFLSLPITVSICLYVSVFRPPRRPNGKASPRERKVPGSNRACGGTFRGRVIPVTQKLAFQWLPCQAPGVMGSALGLVGPVSVYCDWVRKNV